MMNFPAVFSGALRLRRTRAPMDAPAGSVSVAPRGAVTKGRKKFATAQKKAILVCYENFNLRFGADWEWRPLPLLLETLRPRFQATILRSVRAMFTPVRVSRIPK
jgi:hypothetical protein